MDTQLEYYRQRPTIGGVEVIHLHFNSLEFYLVGLVLSCTKYAARNCKTIKVFNVANESYQVLEFN